jgi:hypothetical protein
VRSLRLVVAAALSGLVLATVPITATAGAAGAAPKGRLSAAGLDIRWPPAAQLKAELRTRGHITIYGNNACGASMSMSPATAVTGGEGLTVSIGWPATPSTAGCAMEDNSCPTGFFSIGQDCDAGYWLVGIFCSTLAAADPATAEPDCDLNNIVDFTDYNSGPDTPPEDDGSSYNQCTTVSLLGSIFGGLPGTLQCIADGSASDGWGDDWPTGDANGSASGVYEETGSSTPFSPSASVDCPPSATDIADGALPNYCAFVVMPLFFTYVCSFDICTPNTENLQPQDYMATVFQYAYPPSFTTGAAASVKAGAKLRFSVGTNASPAATVSESGALPPGITFEPQAGGGLLTGTTDRTGRFPITFTAGNSQGGATQSFVLTVKPKAPPPPPPLPQGFWLASADGHVAAAGGAVDYGHLVAAASDPVVGVEATPDGKGYWEVSEDGTVGAYGDARFEGDLPALKVHATDIVALAPTTDGRGYWLIGSDGGMFAFGDARFHGSLPGSGIHLTDVVGMVASRSGAGYLLVGADGGVFAFGATHFYGSLPGRGVAVHDICAILPAPAGTGYLLVGADGGVFSFGHGAPFEGSLPGARVTVHDVVGIALTPDAKGYWMARSGGDVYAFGDARRLDTPPGVSSNLPVTAIAGT